MKKIRLTFTLSLLIGFCLCATASYASSEISGKITDEEAGFEIMMATVQVYKDGSFIQGTVADEFGKYTIKPIEPGTYDLIYRAVGYQPLEYTGVIVSGDQITFLDVGLKLIEVEGAVVIGKRIFEKPLIEIDKVPSGMLITAKELKTLPSNDPNDAFILSAGVYQAERGAPIQVRGSRPGSTLYLLDGMKVDNFNGIPSGAIDQLEVITGGIPAKYGDTTAGVVILNTK